MFRPLSKKKNELRPDLTRQLLKQARRGVLALQGDEGYPYAIPINFFYDEDAEKIYFHGARKGYKVDALQQSDKVCFTVYGPEIIREESWAPFVQSAVIFGRCHLVEDRDRALSILKKFALKYYPNEQMVLNEIKESGHDAQIFEIEIEHMTGKEVQEK